ncbi:MAG: alanine--tRNA ligase-related protein, partial [Candidatus Nanoarchaeia archaeon]
MTEALYLKDCYLKEFEASVERVDGKMVVLEKTAFYPESGGQPTD